MKIIYFTELNSNITDFYIIFNVVKETFDEFLSKNNLEREYN